MPTQPGANAATRSAATSHAWAHGERALGSVAGRVRIALRVDTSLGRQVRIAAWSQRCPARGRHSAESLHNAAAARVGQPGSAVTYETREEQPTGPPFNLLPLMSRLGGPITQATADDVFVTRGTDGVRRGPRRRLDSRIAAVCLLLAIAACGCAETRSRGGDGSGRGGRQVGDEDVVPFRPGDVGDDAAEDGRRHSTRDAGGSDDDGSPDPSDGSPDPADGDAGGGDAGPPPEHEIACADGVDDDLDGLVDCDDPDCGDGCERCADLRDNDGDALVDCDDPDCSEAPVCPERCHGGEDDDADGLVDCADPECATAERCTSPPVSADDWVFSDRAGYFYSLQIPPTGSPCCFNYDDDPALDNALALILGLIPDFGAQRDINVSVNSGSAAIVIEWTETPGSPDIDGLASFNTYRGVPVEPERSPDVPESTTPDDNTWRDGLGVFRIYRSGFDERGPRARFVDARLEGGVLTGGPHVFNLLIPASSLGGDLDLTLNQARVSIDLHQTTNSRGDVMWVSVPETGPGDTRLGGGRLGGTVMADELMGSLNVGAQRCGCARPPGASGNLISFGEQADPPRYVAECQWSPLAVGDAGYSCTRDDGGLCDDMATLCDILPLIALMLDVDTNGNLANESLSVGLMFDLTGARIDPSHPLAD